MSLQYVELSEISGPFVFLDNVENASYEEMVKIECGDGTTRLGRMAQLEGRETAIQVFEKTNGISLKNTKTKLIGKPMELALSRKMLG